MTEKEDNEQEGETHIAVFNGKSIKRKLANNGWFFSVVDIVRILTEQDDFQTSRKYWNKLSERLRDEGSEVVTQCHWLKLTAEDGKERETDCANTEAIFRIIQSIPSKKAEPFRRWLAKIGYGRVKEIENPESGHELNLYIPFVMETYQKSDKICVK